MADRRSLPRPGTQHHRAGAQVDTKQARYRQRGRASGCCTRCRAPCAPYYECEKCRFMHNLQRCLRTLWLKGQIDRTLDGKWCATGVVPAHLLRARPGVVEVKSTKPH